MEENRDQKAVEEHMERELARDAQREEHKRRMENPELPLPHGPAQDESEDSE